MSVCVVQSDSTVLKAFPESFGVCVDGLRESEQSWVKVIAQGSHSADL